MTSPVKRCKDCVAEGVTTQRILATKKNGELEPGPRCVTHHRKRRREQRTTAHSRHVSSTYDITEEEYWAIYKAQGECCFICRKAKGLRKLLAVDHNHETGAVRGLLCVTCNRVVIGRYDQEALARAIIYLQREPAQEVLQRLRSESDETSTNGE